MRIDDADELNFSSGVMSPNHPRCSNCGVTDSPLWRRDPEGNTVCNACGELFSSPQSHNPLCFAIGPLLGGCAGHVSPRRDRQSLNLISILNIGGAVHLAIFLGSLHFNDPKVACPSPGLFPLWIIYLQCYIHAHSSLKPLHWFNLKQ